jgi:O-antigen polysaccharide polymerase Wzy
MGCRCSLIFIPQVEQKLMPLKSKDLTPVFAAVWVCVAVFAIWQTSLRDSDGASAIAAGLLLITSLLFSRYLLYIPFASGPMVYLILLGIFHLGLIVPWAFGFYDISRTPSFTPYGLSRSIALIDYSVVAFSLGMFFAFTSVKKRVTLLNQTSTDTEDRNVYIAGCLMLGAGIAMFVVGLIGLEPLAYFRLTYSETFRLRAESDPRFFGSGITIAFIGLSVAAAGASRSRFRVVSAIGVIWLGGLMYWGFRGPALIAALIVYIIARKKSLQVPRWMPILAALALLILLPILRAGREIPLNNRLANLSLDDFNILDAPAEMGMSIRPLVETVDLLGPKDFRLGKTYWIAVKGIVPNLALRWEASSTESELDLPPSHWITAMVDPWTYKNYGGMGFSAIAEPYMNFGVPGVIAYFFLLSFLLIFLERLSIRSAYSLAAWALILGPLLWTTRNDFSNFFRPAAWGLLTLAAVKLFSEGYSNFLKKRYPRLSKLNPKLVRVKHV